MGGMSRAEIVSRINREHPEANLTPSNVQDYLEKHEDHIRNRRNESLNNALVMSLESVQQTLLETVGEIRNYLEEYKDDPKHAANFLKLKLDAIEKMTKMLGGYPSEAPTVNVQVNTLVTKEAFEKSLKDAEGYFESLERVGGEHAV